MKGIDDFAKRDGRADRGAGQGEAAPGARRARALPALRRRDRRDHPRELEGVRLHELEEPGGGGLRLRDLEAGRGPHAHARGRPAADRGGPDPGSTLRLPVTERQTFSRPARLERRGQGRVRASRCARKPRSQRQRNNQRARSSFECRRTRRGAVIPGKTEELSLECEGLPPNHNSRSRKDTGFDAESAARIA